MLEQMVDWFLHVKEKSEHCLTCRNHSGNYLNDLIENVIDYLLKCLNKWLIGFYMLKKKVNTV